MCALARALAGGQRQAAQLPQLCGLLTAALLPSAGAFRPVAFSLGLLLVMATAFPVPSGEDSKDDTNSNRPQPTSPNQTENLIKSIFLEISEVRNKVGKLYRG